MVDSMYATVMFLRAYHFTVDCDVNMEGEEYLDERES